MTAKETLDRTLRLIRNAVADEISDDAIVNRLQGVRVRCVMDKANASSYSAQTALVTLVSLISRMGVQLVLDVPDIELVGPQPPLRGTRLCASLADLGDDLVPGTTVNCEPDITCDLTFAFGDTRVPTGLPGWRMIGTEWAGGIADLGTGGVRWDASKTIGGMVAAALAAPEVFKLAIRSLPLRQPAWVELLAPCRSASWDFGSDGLILPREPVAVDVISAGAITQAALFTLLRQPMTLTGRLFDDDFTECSNINRQMLLRRSDAGMKVDIVAQVAAAMYTCTPVHEHFALTASLHHLPLAPHVLIGADNIPARWDAQRAASGWLGVGGTSQFEVSVASHEPKQPCAGCLHPLDGGDAAGPVPTVSFVSFWAGLALAMRLLRHIGGMPYSTQNQQLWLASLRMDEQNARLWRPVAVRPDCPVRCDASASATSLASDLSA
jgi:hypothetical protein